MIQMKLLEMSNNKTWGHTNITNLVETIMAHNGLNIGLNRRNFYSPLLEYVLQTELPRG